MRPRPAKQAFTEAHTTTSSRMAGNLGPKVGREVIFLESTFNVHESECLGADDFHPEPFERSHLAADGVHLA
jgi:hypothetical protein